MQCPLCGTNVPLGVLICPNCGGEIAGQPTGTHGDDISVDTADHGVDRTVGGAPSDATRDELVGMWQVKRDPYTGGPLQGTSISREGSPSSFGRWLGGALAIVVVVAIIGIMIFLFGGVSDGDDDGDGGNGGNGVSDLSIDVNMTNGYYLYEPPGEYRCEVVIRNNALTDMNLTGLEVEVAVLTSSGRVAGFDTEGISGTLLSGGLRYVGVSVGTDLTDPSETVTFRVRLMHDDGSGTLDEHRFTYAI